METISRDVLTFLLNSLWQVPVIAAVAALACRLMRNGPANHRHAVWVAALIAATVLPLASVYSGERSAQRPFVAPAAPELSHGGSAASAAAAGTSSSPATERTISYAQTTATLLLTAYLLFLLFRFGRLGVAWMRTARIRDAAAPAELPAMLRQVRERCQDAFGVAGVELLCSARVESPVAAGTTRKTIILPQALFTGTSEELLTTAIGHEMAHLARHDFALKLLYEMLYLPVAFHPAAWLILRGIEETREMACDELVTRKLLAPEVYARSIVCIASTMVAVANPGYTLGVFDGDILEQRIRRLLHRPALNLKRARLLLAGGLSALALCTVIASGVALTARAQTTGRAELTQKKQAAQDLMKRLMQNRGDTQLQSDTRQALLDILSRDPGNQEAMNGMMTLSIMIKQPEEARQWALKMVAQYPDEKTSYYCVGFADWSVVYPAVTAARTAAGMRPDDPNFIADATVRENLRSKYGPIVDEGMQMLRRTLQMDPNYVDAMAYINLLYRMKSNLSDTPAESAKMTAQADEWVEKALDAKRNHSDTSERGSWTQAPPPPPPPPPPPSISDTAMASEAPLPGYHKSERGTFWQVVGASGMPAKQLIGQLKAAGFPAGSALSGSDSLVRVVVGPYADEASLADARTKLEGGGYRVIRPW